MLCVVEEKTAVASNHPDHDAGIDVTLARSCYKLGEEKGWSGKLSKDDGEDADADGGVPLTVGWTAAVGLAAGLGCCVVLLVVALGYICLLRAYARKVELGPPPPRAADRTSTRV